MEYLTISILLLLLLFIYLIKIQSNCLLVVANAMLLIIFLQKYITKEKFQVSDMAFLSDDSMNRLQKEQENEINMLEDNLKLLDRIVKDNENPGLNGEGSPKNENAIEIMNTCIDDDDDDDLSDRFNSADINNDGVLTVDEFDQYENMK